MFFVVIFLQLFFVSHIVIRYLEQFKEPLILMLTTLVPPCCNVLRNYQVMNILAEELVLLRLRTGTVFLLMINNM